LARVISMISRRHLRNHSYEEVKIHLKKFVEKRLGINQDQQELIVRYLKERSEEVKGKACFGIVYDVTNYCNLNCAHCAVNAKLTNLPIENISFETSLDEVRTILEKLHHYVISRSFPRSFLMFGGGEPTLRPDFEDILKIAARLFGRDNIGFNSNGTCVTPDELIQLGKCVSIVEISIDGLEKYHNNWRDPKRITKVTNPFKSTFDLVSQVVQDRKINNKLEVSSVPTKDNLIELPQLVEFLRQTGVRNYSIHRAMPVGRMALRLDRVPDARDYAHLLLLMAKQKQTARMPKLHLHHSLESIYSALLIGLDIHHADLLMSSGRHSIGIDPEGNVFFDPWSVVDPFRRLVSGNLLESTSDMADLIESEDSVIRITDDITRKRLRCKACRMPCCGGMRFNALSYYLSRLRATGLLDIHEGHFIDGLSQIDPACPLSDG